MAVTEGQIAGDCYVNSIHNSEKAYIHHLQVSIKMMGNHENSFIFIESNWIYVF
jgi:hypothetical protein